MKTKLPSITGILCLFFFLNSCTSSKNSIDQHKAETESVKEDASCFVLLKDGTVKNYSSLKLVTGVFKTPHLVADGNVVINPEEIKAYQNKEHFAVSQKQFNLTKKSWTIVISAPNAIRH